MAKWLIIWFSELFDFKINKHKKEEQNFPLNITNSSFYSKSSSHFFTLRKNFYHFLKEIVSYLIEYLNKKRKSFYLILN
jgi:hypothetical protein